MQWGRDFRELLCFLISAPVALLLATACASPARYQSDKGISSDAGVADAASLVAPTPPDAAEVQFGEARYVSCEAPSRKESEWWKTVTTFSSGKNPLADSQTVQPDAVRGLAFQSGWYGFWSLDEQRRQKTPWSRWHKAHEQGLRRVLYFDGGEVGDFAIFTDASGAVVENGWTLPQSDAGEDLTPHWFGLEAFMDDVDWAPYPTAQDYDLEPFTMPDGKEKKDIYDALAARDLSDAWQYAEYSNAAITDDMAEQSGLDKLSHRQTAGEDIANKTGWVINRLVHVDFANLELAKYHSRELTRVIKALHPDGIHVDNLGESNTQYPQYYAFGVWARARFRYWLQEQFSPSELDEMGIGNLAQFDILAYVLRAMKSMDGDRDAQMNNEQWTQDPIWLSYLVFLSEAAATYHKTFYRTTKQATAWGSDIMVAGNLVPVSPGATLVRGACDLPIFEWWTTKGFGPSRPMGLPPFARIGYVTRLAAHLCTASYSVPSLYVSKNLSGEGHENLHKVLAMDALANAGVLDYGYQFLDGYSPGTSASAAFVNRFVSSNSERLTSHRYLPDIALVYSDWSQTANITVRCVMPEKMFDEYAGWATYLSHAHRQWDVLLAEDMDLQRLSDFSVVVLPSVSVLTDEQAAALRQYVDNGGRLIVTGDTGSRDGPSGYLLPRATGALTDLVSNPNVHMTPERPASAYWASSGSGAEQLDALLDFPTHVPPVTTDAPETVSVDLGCAYEDGAHELTLDLVNYALDPQTDAVTPAPDVTVQVTMPDGWGESAVHATAIQADDSAGPQSLDVQAVGHSTVSVRVPSFRFATLVTLEP